MNIHALVDTVSIKSTEILIFNNKLFSESITSPTYSEHLNNITLNVPKIDGEGQYEVEAETLVGKMDPAFRIHQWKGEEYPTIIYHHGNLERPFHFQWYMKNTFRDIFLGNQKPFEANLIVLRAPYHKGSIFRYAKRIGHLTNFIALLSVSARLFEFLVSYFKSIHQGRMILTGISLGGLAVNLHRTYFNTADVYIPLCAGAALADVFVTSAYRRVAQIVHEQREMVQGILDFERDFREVKTNNIFPLLARHDQLFRFERQKEGYEGHSVEVLDRGHWTSALSSSDLRRHILRHLN
ncbi:MAG: hypothetical protein PVF22_04105 [Candidatus Aminicenantes bacterium]|jgi:hypothetical protein